MCRTIGKGVSILLAGTLIGVVLLWISYLLPVTEESVHVAESTLLLEQEGWYPTVPLMHQHRNTDVSSDINPGGILDNFTDSIMITTASHRPDGSALYQAMNMACDEIQDGYSYYWHGYVAILRPLLLFLNYADMRVLNQLLQILLVVTLACMIYRRKGTSWAALSLTVYGLLLPLALSQSLQYSWVFYIGMFGSLTIVRYRDWLAEQNRLFFLFLGLGMLTCYMDLLTYPLFTWGIPMIWWIVTGNDRETDKKQLASVILCGIAWVCGYGGLWIGKWLIGGVILHRPVWIQAWNEVQYRAGTIPDTDGYEVSHWKVLSDNLGIFQSIQGISLLGGWILWWACRIVKNQENSHKNRTLALLLIALAPIVWYVVLHNHTYVHSRYTYRIWVVALTALLAAMINSLDGGLSRQCGRGKRILSALVVLTAITVSLNIKEETFSHNGGYVPAQLELGEIEELTQEFTPSHSLISAINLLLYADAGQTGEIEIKLFEEDRVLWESAVPASAATGGSFYELPASLRLKRDTTYRIRISGRNLEGGQIAVGVTDTGLYPLTELSMLYTGQRRYDAQLICGFRYRHRARLRILALAVELQLLLYWNVYLLWKKCLLRNR